MSEPERVHTSELYESERPRSRPARPGRLTNGTLQLKLRDSKSSPPPPVLFPGYRRASSRLDRVLPMVLPESRLPTRLTNSVFSAKACRTCSGVAGLIGWVSRPVQKSQQPGSGLRLR